MRLPSKVRRHVALAVSALLASSFSAVVASAAPSAAEIADTIITNGRIYAVEPDGSFAQAVAIKDGKILAIGTEADVGRHRGSTTKIIDLKGRLALPGIADNHVHVGMAGAELVTYTCNFSGYADFDAMIAKVRECAAAQPAGSWIIGQYWSSKLYDRLADASALEALDAASGDHPVLLRNDTIHDRWVNSRALAIAGITKATPDPLNGKFGKDPKTGELNGLLLESATKVMEAKIPAFAATADKAEYARRLAAGVAYLNSRGVTAFTDAAVTYSDTTLYETIEKDGRLTAHTQMCLLVDPKPDFSAKDVETLFLGRERFASGLLRMNCGKIFVDGVQVSRTGYFIDPYLPDDAHGSNYRGEPKMDQDTLDKMVVALDREGIATKLHVAGDGAIRMALHAIAAARKANGNNGPLHTLAHAGYMQRADFADAAQLRAVVDASPTIWFPGPVVDGSAAALGPRGYGIFPFKTFAQNGVAVVGGTDWKTLPGEFSSLWEGIEGMVTRKNPVGAAPGALHPEEALSVAETLKIYTLNSAQAMGLGDKIGSLKPGKEADIIVLDQDIFEINPDRISDTRVDLTILGGKTVFDRATAQPR